MPNRIELDVHLARDPETGRWYVAESDIPGLWLEADDPIALIERISVAAPELIELNAPGASVTDRASARHRIRPVFDSPLELAYM